MGNSSMTNEAESQVLILLNGHRVGSPDLSLQMLANVERIEVIRGPAAMQHGAAIAGVVNLITKRGQEGAFTTTLQIGAGSYGFLDQKMSFSGETNGFDLAFGAYHAKRDDYKNGSGQKWLHTGYDNKLGFDLDAGYTFLDVHRLGINFLYSKIDSLELPTSGFPDTHAYPNNFGKNNQYLHNTTFSYEGSTIDKVFSWSAAYTFGQVNNDGLSYSTLEAGCDLYGFIACYPDANNKYITHTKLDQIKTHLTFDKDVFTLTAGIDYLKYIYSLHYISYQFDTDSYSEVSSKDLAIYLLTKTRLFNERLIISAAGRYDSIKSNLKDANTENTEHRFSPSVGVAFMATDFLKLRANYAKGYRLPSPLQILGNPTYSQPANPDLKIENSKSFEIGADLSFNYIDANVTFFHTNVNNKIVSNSANAYQAINLKHKSTIAGFEAGLRFDIGRMLNQDFSLSPYANITWITTRKKNPLDEPRVPQAPDKLPYVPKVMANYGLDFSHSGIGLESQLNINYVGKSYSQNFNYLVDIPGLPRSAFAYYGGFTTVDLSLKKQLWDTGDKGKFYAKVDLNNIFDEDYAYVMDYPMPGRNFYVALGYEY
jgi:vitamin B12 transporter